MSSDNESPAVVELPDDLIEANAAAQLAVMRTAPPSLNDVIATVLIAAEPLIAARVRAEALREAVEKIAPNQVRPSNVIVVGARMTDDVLDMVRTVEDALVAAVHAEAVADERRRIVGLIDAARRQAQRGDPMADNTDLILLRREVAAGSVPVAAPPAESAAEQLLRDIFMDPGPVATPPRVEVASIPLDDLPDWTELAEAAGATLQNHEIGCSGEYETVMHWSDGRRAGNRDRLAIISEDAEMEQFADAAVGPVATRLQPGRVGFGTDAFEVGGSLPGQPVATPTEPAHMHNWDGPCPACASATPTEQALTSDDCTCEDDGGCIDYYDEDRPGDCAYCQDPRFGVNDGATCPAVLRVPAASPVPAEQPEER